MFLFLPVGTPPVGTGPYHKGGELLKTPNLTTPQGYNTWSPPGGGIELEGASKFTVTWPQYLLSVFGPKRSKQLCSLFCGTYIGFY